MAKAGKIGWVVLGLFVIIGAGVVDWIIPQSPVVSISEAIFEIIQIVGAIAISVVAIMSTMRSEK